MSEDAYAYGNPMYAEVSNGETSYLEVVHILYNSLAISYKDLVKHFFTFHDPTTMDKERTDSRFKYPSAIFFHSPK